MLQSIGCAHFSGLTCSNAHICYTVTVHPFYTPCGCFVGSHADGQLRASMLLLRLFIIACTCCSYTAMRYTQAQVPEIGL